MTEVVPNIHITPERRTASYAVKLDDVKLHDLVAVVSAKRVTLTGRYSGYSNTRTTIELPKTHEALDALYALVGSMHKELALQGIDYKAAGDITGATMSPGGMITLDTAR
jgi:hypothetical protein